MTTDPARIRAWGIDNGWPVGERGRISAELREAYEDAQASRIQPPVALADTERQLEATGHTFAWEGTAWVVRDADGAEVFRSTLGFMCARWATERGIKLGSCA